LEGGGGDNEVNDFNDDVSCIGGRGRIGVGCRGRGGDRSAGAVVVV
jgi:hypothetical protein